MKRFIGESESNGSAAFGAVIITRLIDGGQLDSVEGLLLECKDSVFLQQKHRKMLGSLEWI